MNMLFTDNNDDDASDSSFQVAGQEIPAFPMYNRYEETEFQRAPAIHQTQCYDLEMLGPWGLNGNLLAPSPRFPFMLLASNVPANKNLLDEFAKHSSMQSTSARS